MQWWDSELSFFFFFSSFLFQPEMFENKEYLDADRKSAAAMATPPTYKTDRCRGEGWAKTVSFDMDQLHI